jgi:hypothetical protein
VEAIQPPSTEVITLEQEDAHVYFPFATAFKCYPRNCNSRLNQIYSGNSVTAILMDSISQECLQGRSSTGTSGVDLWTTIITTDDDEQGNFYDDCICGFLKSNGNGFRCFNKPKPPATKEQAIDRYTTEYPPETICAPLKQNSPF